MPKLALSPVNEPNSPILIVSWENTEPVAARMTPKIRRNRRFIISAQLLAIGKKTARTDERLAFGVWRLAFGVWRLAFGVWRLAARRLAGQGLADHSGFGETSCLERKAC